MGQLKIQLFGSPQLEIGGRSISLKRRKTIALLVYLAVTRQAHGRDTLATLFWPDYDQRSARANLRRTLSGLKKSLDDGWLTIDRENVGLDREADIWIDIEEFRLLLSRRAAHDHPKNEVCPACIPLLTDAINLYSNDFLAGFTLQDSPSFDDWQLFQAEELRRELAEALDKAVQAYIDLGDFHSAIPHARRRLGIDPLHEPAHRQLMRLYTWSGQYASAVRQYEEAVRVLDEELGLPPEEKTTQLFKTIKAKQLPPPQAAKLKVSEAASHKSFIHNLPSRHAPFIGREDELAEIKKLLIDEADCRLLTLVGPGGIGKTSLGTEAASQLLESFPDGVFFVSLAPVLETSLIVPAMGEALDFRFQGTKELKEQLFEHLHTMQTLLLVDNFEHMLDGVDLLTEILDHTSGVILLATSRERLNLREEWVYEVKGLPYPSQRDLEQIGRPITLEEYPAIHLFHHYARRASAAFSISSEEMPHVVQLCQLLDGMPLGLELAAPWVRSMSIQEIATEIAHNLDFLSTPLRNIPDRHSSLRVVFEQTWQRLSVDEQSILARLSVFQGGCWREAAEKVARATIPVLSSIVEKALLRRSQDGRYDMHALIRQFAAEKLKTNTTEYESVHNRHSIYYAAFLQQLEDELAGRHMLRTFKRIEEENDNVFAALDWAITQKDAFVFEQAAETFSQYWSYPSLERQGVKIIERAVTALTGSAERGLDIQYPGISPNIRTIVGFLIAIEGAYIGRISSPRQGIALTMQGVALQDASTPKGKRRLAWSKFWLGMNYYLTGNYQEAEPEFREAFTLFSDVQYPHGIAWCLNRLGSIRYQYGRFEEAEQFFEDGNKLSDKHGFSLVGGFTCLLQAMKANDQGNYSRAMVLLNKSLALYQDVGDYLDRAGPIRERGRLYSLLGKYDRAKEELDQSMVLYRKHGGDWYTEVNLNIVGNLNRLQGNYDKAEQLYNRSLSAAREVDNQRLTAMILSGLGIVAYDRGDYTRAEQLQLEALDIFKGFGNEPEIASVLRHLGQVIMALSKHEYKQYYREALQLAEMHRLAPVALDVVGGIARLYAHSGRELEAVELLTMVAGHESSTYETKTNAQKELKDIASGIDDDQVITAQNRGREMELWNTSAKLLAERL